MIYSKRTEKNLVNSTEAVINIKVDYTDTLTFRVPINEDVVVEDILIVKSRIINQQYRVHEVTAKGMFKEVFCKHVFFDIEKVVIDTLPIGNETDIEDFVRHLNLKLKEKRLDFKVDVDTLRRSKELSQGVYSVSMDDYQRTLEWVVNTYRLDSNIISTVIDDYLRETNQSNDTQLKNDMTYSFTHLIALYSRCTAYVNDLKRIHKVDVGSISIPTEELEKRETMYKTSNMYKNISSIVGKFTHQGKDLLRVLSETTLLINKIENTLDKYRRRKANISVNDTNLYNLIFAEKGILKTFDYKVVWDNYKLKFVNGIVGNNTEILFHEKKNISDMQNSSSSKPLVTRLYVTCKYKVDKNSEEYKQQQAEIRRTNYENKTNEIEERYRQEDAERERKRAISDASRNTPTTRRTKEQINQDIIGKRRLEDAERERKRQLAREKRASTFNAREEAIANKEANKQAEENARTFKCVVESPLINVYSRVYEDTITFESSEISSVEQLEEYCKHKFFNEYDTRDIPTSTFSFTPVQEELRISLYDYARVVFDSLERVNKVVQCVEIKYDPVNDKYIKVEFGDATVNTRYSQLSAITENMKSYVNDKYNAVDGVVSEIEKNFNLLLQKEQEAFDLMFDDKKTEFELELENNIKEAELKVIEQNGVLEQQINSKIEAEANKSQELIDEFKQSFDSEKQELLTNINSVSTDVNSKLESTNRKIEENREEATRLTNAVREEANNLFRNIKVGGRNLIHKSGTMSGSMWTNGGGNWRLLTEQHLQLPVWSWVSGNKVSQIVNVPVKSGETYTFSNWVKRDSAGRLYLYLYDTFNDNNSDARLDIRRDHTFENNAEWQFVKLTFTATRDGLVKVRYAMVNSDTGGFSITPFMLERGTVATDWRPAPEDVDYTREINELRTNVEQTNRGLREDVTRINQKFDNAGNLVELARYKTEREATDRDITTKITELQLYKDGEAERTAVIENKIIESARGTEQKISETYSNIGLNYFRNTKTFGGDWYTKWAWVLESETNNGFAVMSRSGAWQGVSQSVYSEAEQWWTYSFDVKGVDVSSVAIYTRHGADSAAVTVGASNQINVTNEFARYSHTFKVGTAGIIRPSVVKTANSGKIYISKIKLEKGRIATPWTPHVDDNETYTSDRLVTINNSLDGIRTTITGVDRRVSDINSNLNTYKSEREQTDRATREQLTALNTYMNADGTRQTNILSLAERKTAELLSREMTNVSQNYVANSVLTETVRGIDRKFSELRTTSNNLLKNSNVAINNSSEYKVASYLLTETIEDGEDVTLTLKVKFNSDTTNVLMPYNSGGSVNFGFAFRRENNQDSTKYHIVSKTFKWRSTQPDSGRTANNTSLDFYHYTSSNVKPISIAWATLIRGTVGTTDWSPSKEDNLQVINNKIAEYRQTVDGQIATVRGIANDGKALATRVEQDLAGVRTNVSSLSGDVFKKSEFRQTDDKFILATGYEFDGRKLGSMISLSPDGIKAVADKMIITADNENLIPHRFRNRIEFNSKYYWFGARYKQELKPMDEFYFDFNSVLEKLGGIQGWYIGIRIRYTDSTNDWITEWCGTTGGGVVQGREDNGPETLKIPANTPNSAKVLEYWEPYLLQNSNSGFATVRIENLKLYKKKSAELIVNGSITAKHLDTDSVRTGILTANSITSTMLNSNVILAKHLKVDSAMIDKLMLNDLLVSKIIAKQAFINKVKAIDIDASRITSGVLQATNGNVYINLDTGYTRYKESASIRFMSSRNNLYYQNGTSKAFVNFTDATIGGASAAIGVNSDGEVDTNTGSFAGVKVFRNTGKQGGQFLDQVDIVGDSIIMTGGTNENNGIVINTTKFSAKLDLYGFLKLCNDNFKDNGMYYSTDCFN